MRVDRREFVERDLRGINESEYKALVLGLKIVAGTGKAPEVGALDRITAISMLKDLGVAEPIDEATATAPNQLAPGSIDAELIHEFRGGSSGQCMVHLYGGTCRKGKDDPIHRGNLPQGVYATHHFDGKGHFDGICRALLDRGDGKNECRRGKKHPIHPQFAPVATGVV